MESIQERVLKVVAEESGYDAADLKPIDNLQMDLGMDSMDMLNFQMALEAEFDENLPDKGFRNMRTIGELIEFVEQEV